MLYVVWVMVQYTNSLVSALECVYGDLGELSPFVVLGTDASFFTMPKDKLHVFFAGHGMDFALYTRITAFQHMMTHLLKSECFRGEKNRRDEAACQTLSRKIIGPVTFCFLLATSLELGKWTNDEKDWFRVRIGTYTGMGVKAMLDWVGFVWDFGLHILNLFSAANIVGSMDLIMKGELKELCSLHDTCFFATDLERSRCILVDHFATVPCKVTINGGCVSIHDDDKILKLTIAFLKDVQEKCSQSSSLQ